MKKFNFNDSDVCLLNQEESKKIQGGLNDCRRVGDTMYQYCLLVQDYKIVRCATHEATCGSGFDIDSKTGEIECGSLFKLKER